MRLGLSGKSNRIWALTGNYAPLIVLLILSSYMMFSNLEDISKTAVLAKWNYDFFSGIANNTLEYGFVGTKFGQLMNLEYGGVQYYVNHPPLLGIYLAVSFMVLVPLGWTQEAAATLVPTLFSLGSLTLLYMIGGRLWGTKVAFLSTLVMMLTPMFRKYSQLICHEPPTTFFILAVVYCYILWVETLEHRYFNLTCAFIMVGCFTGWPVYYTIPLLTVHYIIFGKSGYSKVALILPSIGLLMFSLFLIHLYVLDGETAFSKLDYGLKSRLDYGNVRRMGVLYNVKILVDYMNLVKRANTVYVFYVSGLLLLSMAYGIIRKHDVRRESYVLILISVAVIHNLLWPSGVKIHDYWSYYFTPALSLAAVAGLNSALEDIKGYWRVIVWAVFLFCFIVSSTTQF